MSAASTTPPAATCWCWTRAATASSTTARWAAFGPTASMRTELLRRHRRTVRGIGHDADRRAGQVCRYILRHPLERAAKEVLGNVAHVRRNHDVVERSERMIRRQRLAVE